MKERFISMVSHQLKSPLAAVQQYISVILDGMAGDVLPEQKKMLERSSIRIRGLLKLIKDWLDLSGSKYGRTMKTPEKLDLNVLLPLVFTGFCETMSGIIDETHIEMEINLENGLPPVIGCGELLKQAINNLLENAVYYNKDRGRVEFSACAEEEFVKLTVRDTGNGIPRDNLSFVFDEFYRIKTGGNNQVDGNGLGLAIVKKIVKDHSGRIEVKSQAGKGTIFNIFLPRIKEQSGKFEKNNLWR